MTKFTETSVAKIAPPPGSTDYIAWDDETPGFGIRFQNGAERGTFIVQYRIGTKQRRQSVGRVGKVTLEAAREAAKTYNAKVALKIDPAIERAKAVSKASTGIGAAVYPEKPGDPPKSLIDLFIDYLRDDQRRAPSYVKENKRSLERYFSHLHQFAPDDVDRETVATELRKIKKDHGPIAMNRSRSHLSKFFNWMIGEGKANHNPVLGTNKADENIRDLVLTPAELAKIWNACDGDEQSDKITRLLMLTAARRDQICKLCWSEVNFDEERIELPAKLGRTKNKAKFLLPLSRQALAILKAVDQREGNDFVFGEGEKGFSGHSNAKERIDAIMKERKIPVADWTFHDFRTAFMTHAQEKLKVPFYIADLLLSHTATEVRKGSKKNYNFAKYIDEKTEAMNKWGDYIEGITTAPTSRPKKKPNLRLVA
jgi:integrase